MMHCSGTTAPLPSAPLGFELVVPLPLVSQLSILVLRGLPLLTLCLCRNWFDVAKSSPAWQNKAYEHTFKVGGLGYRPLSRLFSCAGAAKAEDQPQMRPGLVILICSTPLMILSHTA